MVTETRSSNGGGNEIKQWSSELVEAEGHCRGRPHQPRRYESGAEEFCVDALLITTPARPYRLAYCWRRQASVAPRLDIVEQNSGGVSAVHLSTFLVVQRATVQPLASTRVQDRPENSPLLILDTGTTRAICGNRTQAGGRTPGSGRSKWLVTAVTVAAGQRSDMAEAAS
ncbi:hypothetical protein RJ55_02402 [Drechmeria coniospora]|nr:hypothetical protein RJ55_02402 [Drechmeria coniospora]